MAKVITIGAPANESERRIIRFLKENLSDSYTIYPNIELTNPTGLPYEYDCIIKGLTRIFVVEMKDYRGEIRGNALEWILDSGLIIKSPFPLLNLKTKVVASRLSNYLPLLGDVWVQSFILIEDQRAHINIDDPQSERVLQLSNVLQYIKAIEDQAKSKDLTAAQEKFINEAIFSRFKPLKKDKKIGEYILIETINKNNLFTTFLARHELIPIPERFFLKVYDFDVYASSEQRKRQRDWVLHDGMVLNALKEHENIVKAYPPFPWEDDQIALPYEWVNGNSLRSILLDAKVIPFEKKLDIALQISKGMEFVHAHDIIHRDLRPENILVPDNGPIKIVNFDCAKWENENMQTIATLVGKHIDERYTAPEVWENARNATTKSDIYSMGILMYEIITGRTPYTRIRDYLTCGSFPTIQTVPRSKSISDLDDLLKKMCAIDLSERIASVSDLIELIEIIRDGSMSELS